MFVPGLGTQAALVALPYQIYVDTPARPARRTARAGRARSADRRRRWWAARSPIGWTDGSSCCSYQIGLVLVPGGACGRLVRRGPVALAALRAGAPAGGRRRAAERRPLGDRAQRWCGRSRMRSALAFSFGLYQLTMVDRTRARRPDHRGAGVGAAYTIDAASCLAMVLAVIAIRPSRPLGVEEHETIWRSIADGLRFVRGNQALLGSFAIDLVAMTFGMPRALFAVLSPSASTTPAPPARACCTRRCRSARRSPRSPPAGSPRARCLGRIVIWAVIAWGAGDHAGAGLASSLWLAAASARGRRAPPTASAPSAARRSTRRSPPITCAGACRRCSRSS